MIQKSSASIPVPIITQGPLVNSHDPDAVVFAKPPQVPIYQTIHRTLPHETPIPSLMILTDPKRMRLHPFHRPHQLLRPNLPQLLQARRAHAHCRAEFLELRLGFGDGAWGGRDGVGVENDSYWEVGGRRGGRRVGEEVMQVLVDGVGAGGEAG